MATTSKSDLQVTRLSETELKITREFDAPREIVFRAMTDPALVARWWGPRRYRTVVDTMVRGEFREIVPAERIVWTFEYEPLPGHISVETMTLTEIDGRTLLTVHDQFSSKEDLDGMVNSGMESGARESYERLDELLAELKTKKTA
jgi:uncharacterized protein YndB with AHSA1/START domain